MRVLRGSEGEELVEMDLSELKENRIIDLNDEGRRWEGGVLKGKVFGYGRLYDEENRLEYEGWMIEGVKRCYGIEYWNDLGVKKYRGSYFNGKKEVVVAIVAVMNTDEIDGFPLSKFISPFCSLQLLEIIK